MSSSTKQVTFRLEQEDYEFILEIKEKLIGKVSGIKLSDNQVFQFIFSQYKAMVKETGTIYYRESNRKS